MPISPQPFVSLVAKSFPEAIFFKETAAKVVALTIDDVPTPNDRDDQSTHWILDAIADHNDQFAAAGDDKIQVTFFVISGHLTQGNGVLCRMIAEGHEIGNHGVMDHTHANLSPRQFDQELKQAHQVLTQTSPATVRWFRPGRGLYNQTMTAALQNMAKHEGYNPRFVLASMLPLDTWALTALPSFTVHYVSQFIFPGAILLLHGGSPQRAKYTVAVLKHLFPHLRTQGYRVVTLSELMFRF